MRGPNRNVDRFSSSYRDLLVVECHFGSAFNDEPVLCPLPVFLVTESFARQDLDPLHLEPAIFLEHRIASPGPAIKLPHTRSSLIRMVERTLGHKKTQRLKMSLCVLVLLVAWFRSWLSTSGRSRCCVASPGRAPAGSLTAESQR